MPIDYYTESEKYRPQEISTLLIGEAPPPGGDKYFYVPRTLSLNKPIEEDRSLPATIFNHYFQKRPESIEAYKSRLLELKGMGIFLIDICDNPIKVRSNKEGLVQIAESIGQLRVKMNQRQISIDESQIIFLLARNSYVSIIRREFPTSRLITWKEFRLGR